jgi:Exocyst complex component Sec8 C-terminal
VVEYEKNGAVNEPAKTLSLETHPRPQRLFRFINDLMVRVNQPPADPEELDLETSRREPGATTSTTFAESSSSNLENDSFGYIETVLESLAVLGELGNGLDVVSQRLPVEIYTLLEATIDEVNERAEFNKRMSLLAPGSTGHPSGVFGSSRGLTLSCLRLTSLESSVKEADQETLRDMFWTLYSKLDAVLQGLRVVYEVANRIGSVSCNLFGNQHTTISQHRDEISKICQVQNSGRYLIWPIYGHLCRLR